MARIRAMTQDDFAAVHAVWSVCEGVGLNESDTEERVTAYLARNPGLSFVAEEGGKVVGAVLCGQEGRRGYLNHLAVHPEHRRKGLGRSLVERVLAEMGKLGIPRCNAMIFTTNAAGRAFWEKMGWKVREDLWVIQGKTGK